MNSTDTLHSCSENCEDLGMGPWHRHPARVSAIALVRRRTQAGCLCHAGAFRKSARYLLVLTMLVTAVYTATVVPAEETDGFVPLFNGRDLTGWSCSPNGWHAEDGVITWAKRAGFLWTEKTYGDFVLDLEFKLGKKTNSGVFIRTASQKEWLHTGIEIQVLDSHGKKEPGRHDCGAVYDCLAPSENAVKPAGEWNRMIITARANRIEVTLNGRQVIDMDLDEWTEPHKNPGDTRNKFNTAYKDMPRAGYIGFQDHGKQVWFRNVKIKELHVDDQK